MKKSLIAICTLSIVLGLSQAALACLCGALTTEGAFASADVVFVGKVIKIAHAKEAGVGMLVKESGTLQTLKVPRWEKSVSSARIVTLEISEPFKGTSNQTIEVLTSVYDGGGTCGVNFRMGESYLVFAYKRRPELSPEEAKLPKAARTKEVQLKTEADKFNERLPILGTGICSGTAHMRWSKEDIDIIRGLIKQAAN